MVVFCCGNAFRGPSEFEVEYCFSFTFCDFNEASNFINRYTDYCGRLNHEPNWNNVYNRVGVTLSNAEFGKVTEKEVTLGKYLDTVSKAHLGDIDAVPFEHLMDVA